MKKQLLVAAVAAASALSFSSALAADSITLYGAARVGLANIDPGTTTGGKKADKYNTAYSAANGMYSTSRWGIRGTEDIGGGLGGVFRFETTLSGSFVSNDENSANAGKNQIDGDRYAYVGVNTPSAGKFLIGKDDRGYRKATGFADQGFMIQSRLAHWDSGRAPGSVFWDSPVWGGLQVFLDHNPNTTYDANLAKGKTTGIGVKFDAAGFRIGLGYDEAVSDADIPVTTNSTTNKAKNAALVASYTIKAGESYSFSPTLIYTENKVDTAANVQTKQTFYGLNVPMSLAGNNLLFIYGKLGDLKSNGASTKDSGADNFGLEYTYEISRRTVIGLAYEQITYKKAHADATKISTDVNGNRIDAKRKVISVGVSHEF